jgi:transcriptional regulator with XRE-family HTH domain
MKPKSINSTDQHVGSRVRMRRMMLDMTQADLSEAIGVTFQQVQKYEKGTNRVSASRLQHIAHVLQVPVSFFFEDADGSSPRHDAPPDEITHFMATADGLALAKAFMRIRNIEVRRRIAALVAEIEQNK